jgi:hypothetical protein
MASYKPWTPDEEAILCDRFAAEGASKLAKVLCRGLTSVQKKAQKMGLRCSPVVFNANRMKANQPGPSAVPQATKLRRRAKTRRDGMIEFAEGHVASPESFELILRAYEPCSLPNESGCFESYTPSN